MQTLWCRNHSEVHSKKGLYNQRTIAPAFYASQVDLSGPYLSYYPEHKITTIIIWLTVLISINVIHNYLTDAFLQPFTQFACDHRHPEKLYCDRSSQVVSGCENMKLNFQDLQFKLHQKQVVDFSICPVGGHNVYGKVERKIKEINP